MITIKLTNIEKRRILSYAEQFLSDRSHWGDSEVSLPEEENIINQCQNSKDEITLTKFQLRLLFQWFIDVTQSGQYLIDEDQSILNKILIGLPSIELTNNEKIGLIEQFLYPERNKTNNDNQINADVNAQIKEKPLKPKSALDEKIEKIGNERKEIDTYKENLIERIKKQRIEMEEADKFLKGIIKKTKGKGVF